MIPSDSSTIPSTGGDSALPSEASPIFVIGSGRSGTTLLRAVLNAHPNIYLTDEASFYVSAARFPQDRGGDDWLDYYTASWPFLWLGLDPGEIRSLLPTPLRRDQVHQAIDLMMGLKAQSHGKPRYGDKTPLHSRFLREIFHDFPRARVVHIVRSPVATVESLTRMPWAPASIGLSLAFLRDRLREIEAFRDRIYEMRLEDLIQDPRSAIQGVLEFVEEPWDDRVLDHPRYAPKNDRPPFPWLQAGTRRVRAKHRRRSLPAPWIRTIEKKTAVFMKRYGYAKQDLDHEPSRTDQVLAHIRDLPPAIAAAWRLWRAYRTLKGWKTPDPTEGIRVLHNINPSAWRHYPDFEYPPLPERMSEE